MSATRVTLPGSARAAVRATVLGPAEQDAPIEISLVLRRRAEPDPAAFAAAPLTRSELAERFGADPADLYSVQQAVEAAGAQVVFADAAARLVRVRGPVGALGELFGTSLESVEWASGVTGRRRSGELSAPTALVGSLLAVLGLDDRPQAAAHFRIARPSAQSVSYTPVQLAAAYGFPAGDGDGAGQRIAIIELGGGFTQDDLDTYFAGLALPTPSVSAVGVDGAANTPDGNPGGVDGEVLLDIEVAGAIAPAAAQLVYFAPNTDAGFLDAISQAAHATPAPTVMSISWGQSEDQWSAQARGAMDAAFADAALLGVTVTAAAGDDGSADRQTSGAPHCDFPASSPHVLGCGGTTLHLAADGTVAAETVWNDGAAGGSTGGGISQAFPVPDYQANAGIPPRAGKHALIGRGVPDVSAVADPQTGYRVLVDGESTVIGGTSAVAPLWAGLVCRLAQAIGRPLGLLHPTLYARATEAASPPGLRDITEGDNGEYAADPGWDACTGLGVPDGAALVGTVSG